MYVIREIRRRCTGLRMFLRDAPRWPPHSAQDLAPSPTPHEIHAPNCGPVHRRGMHVAKRDVMLSCDAPGVATQHVVHAVHETFPRVAARRLAFVSPQSWRMSTRNNHGRCLIRLEDTAIEQNGTSVSRTRAAHHHTGSTSLQAALPYEQHCHTRRDARFDS